MPEMDDVPPFHAFGTDDPDLGGLTNFCGDFYRAPDNVTRGVCMAAPGPEVGPADSWKGLADGLGDGDYYGKFDYQEPDDLLRGGVGMGGSIYDTGPYPGGKLDFAGPLGKGLGGYYPEEQAQFQGAGSAERFAPLQPPPAVPSDAFFALESTTIQLALNQKFDASQIGNDLLKFFQDSVVASISKVRTQKHWVKADVFCGGRRCTLKARIFRQEHGQYAVEFQRRGGDCFAFQDAFNQAVKFYQARENFYSVTAPEQVLGACPTAPDGPATDRQVAPTLDMASFQEIPGLQAEAAAALMELAADPAAAVALCDEQAFAKIQTLLQSDEQDVAYPTAKLLFHLLQQGEAERRFANEDFLIQIAQKVSSQVTSALVKNELVKVLNAAKDLSSVQLTAQAKDKIALALNSNSMAMGQTCFSEVQDMNGMHNIKAPPAMGTVAGMGVAMWS